MTVLPAARLRASPLETLPNGLRYVVVEDHAAPVVSLQIWVRCGGVNENAQTAGVSHFLEHMLFKGTARLTAGEIARIVESRGGSINAATGAETTHYYIDVPSDAFHEAFEVLAESVMNPSFPPEEFEKERLVILEEIKRRNDNPQSDLWDGFLEVLYRRTPYRQQVIGSVQTITAMTRDVLMEQHKQFYVPQNLVVVVIGDVKAAAAKKKVKDVFGRIPRGPDPAFPPLREPPFERSVVREISRPAQQAHVAVGFVGPTLDDPRQVAMDVLATVLGGGQSSRLYQTLREEKRSVWSVGSSFITHHGSGAFGIFAECPPEKARSLPNDLYLLLYDADVNGFRPEELARAKAQIRSSWLFSQETYHGQASQWGFYSALGRPELVRRYLKLLDKVTLADLDDLLGAYFQGRELSGVILMPSGRPDAPAPAGAP
jgi:zinc protease